MKSHSVIYHSTQANVIGHLNPSNAGRYSIYIPRKN